MASVLSHAIVGASAAYILQPVLRPTQKWAGRWYYFLAAMLAMLPDADAIGYALHVPYESLWGHRGMSHSLLFALLVGGGTAFLFVRRYHEYRSHLVQCAFVFVLALASHGLLDAFTTGGLGVAFFSPFDETRYFFPLNLRVIRVSPIGISSFFSEWGMRVIRSEAQWLWLPCLLVVALVWRERRRGSV